MWNKRKDEDYVPRAVAPPAPAEIKREGNPMLPLPARAPEPEAPRGAALIGKAVIVKGQISSREDLHIDGEVDGTIDLQEHRVTIGLHGKVQATIRAREVVIAGTVHGNIEAVDKIDIRKDAKLVGDIKTARIVIEDGAYFKGSIDIQRPEASRTPAAPKPQMAAVAATGAPQQPTLLVNPPVVKL